jgi:hypothetical protein
VILLDLLEPRRSRCVHCQQWTASRALPAPHGDVTSEVPPDGEAIQQELF